MNETELLGSTITEYRTLVYGNSDLSGNHLTDEQLICKLHTEHDWTDGGAEAIVSLANSYGAFMLRNALALAIALNKEDGVLGH